MPDKHIRAFIALDLSLEVKKYLETLISSMKRISMPGVVWVKAQKLHITLKFLGNIKNDQIPLIEECLNQTISRHAPIKTTLSGIGFFPSKDKARVLWAGFNDPDRLLATLAHDIDTTLNSIGFPAENKEFVAHATMARLKIRPAWLNQLSTLTVPTDMTEIFGHITLYQSTLTHQGPIYEPIKIFYMQS